jgi:membrane protease YdiL (CAAX protease family)
MHRESGGSGGPDRPVPWSGIEILLALVLVSAFWPLAVYQLLHASGFYRRVYSEQVVVLASADEDRREQQRFALALLAGPGAADAALPVLRNQAFYRLNLWAMVLAFPFQTATILLLLYGASGTRPAQLGLTTRRLGRNLLAGALGAALLTPAVLGVNWLVEVLYHLAGAGGFREHPLTVVARLAPRPAEWVLLFLTGMVAAPVVEELTFRGMLQPWFAARRWGGHAAMAASFALSVWSCWDRARAAWSLGAAPFLEQAAPAVFVLVLVPFYLVVRWRSRTPAPPAIFGTALLFACVHASVWPSPIALFLLALGLGVLAWRTRSLAGPILLHSLFNGVSCLSLLLGG